jgi:serine/arginine repetitive matrix protein 2
LLSDLNASMYALATLNLSLVHPSSQTTLTARPLEQAKLQPPQVISNVSFAPDCDSSAYNIANIDLSLIHPTGDHKNRPSTESNPSSTRELSRIAQSVEPSRSVHLSLESDTESKREARESLVHSVVQNSHSRERSEMSLSSLGSIINSGVSDPFGYKRGNVSSPPPLPLPVAPSPGHAHSDSLASIPSISSLGRIINPGTRNPFGYAPSTQEHSRNVSEVSEFSLSAYVESSGTGDGRPGEGRPKNRKSTGSDRSTFYFRSKPPPMPLPFPPALRNHQHNESSFSNSSIAPPVSLDHSSFRRHHRNRLSNDSGSSIAHAYGVYGANGGRALWAKHQSEPSIDSVSSDFSGARLGRPGLGDKMLESAAVYRGAPLTSIMASPSASEAGSAEHGHARHSSFDSARDPSDSDSLFEAPHKASSVSSDSVFGADEPKPTSEALLFGKNAGNRRIRPLSVFSVASATSSTKDDDTMISLLGGGHVSCKAVGDSFASSPCFKPKRKRPFQVKLDAHASEDEVPGSPAKLRLVEKKRAVVPQLSSKFGRERMDKATKGLLKRESLEEHSLEAEGADVSGSTSAKGMVSALSRRIVLHALIVNVHTSHQGLLLHIPGLCRLQFNETSLLRASLRTIPRPVQRRLSLRRPIPRRRRIVASRGLSRASMLQGLVWWTHCVP